MFPTKQNQHDDKKPIQKKEFLAIDSKTKWAWYQEEISFLFHPVKDITDLKLVKANDGSFNIYIRLDLKNRFEDKFLDNKKTLAAARKLAEDFIRVVRQDEFISNSDETTFIRKSAIVTFELNSGEKCVNCLTADGFRTVLAEYKTVKEAKEALKNLVQTGELKPSKKETEEIRKDSEENNITTLEALKKLKEEISI